MPTTTSKLPLISIGVSAYNRKDLLRESLDSLLQQDYPEIEIIVVDDGSTDGTAEMVKAEYPQVNYIYQDNAGDAAAKNHAAKMAKGEYIVFNDSDDMFLPDTVSRLYDLVKDHPGACSYGSYITIDAKGKRLPTKSKVPVLPQGKITSQLLSHVVVNCCGFLIPLELFKKHGGFDRSLRAGHDWKLSLILSLETDFYAAADPVFLRRRHGSNLSTASYRGSRIMLDVFEDFVSAHAEKLSAWGKIIRSRRAVLHNKLARQAILENLSGKLIREHLKTALKNSFSWKYLLRYIISFLKK